MKNKKNYYQTIGNMSELCKALGNPTRLKIAFGLAEKEYCNVSIMVEALNISQPGVSQHLTILKNAGIVKVETKGAQRCYSIKNENIRSLIKLLKEFKHEEN